MSLFLIRHADAVFSQDDASRRLSDQGRAQVKQLAAFFAQNRALAPARFWHSPLVRARETAELLRAGLKSTAPLSEVEGLLPEDDPQAMASRLSELSTGMHLALVGHEPFMSGLATLLSCGKTAPASFEMRKGAVLAFERTGALHPRSTHAHWCLRWQITPDLLR
jgi:phosphohistidine phosphatase